MGDARAMCRLSLLGWVSYMGSLYLGFPTWFSAQVNSLAALFCAFLQELSQPYVSPCLLSTDSMKASIQSLGSSLLLLQLFTVTQILTQSCCQALGCLLLTLPLLPSFPVSN